MCTPGASGMCTRMDVGMESLYARDSSDGVIRLGNVVPDFNAGTTQGYWKSFHEWKKGQWCILFSHPADFTPVCTTEILSLAEKYEHLQELGFKVAALSVDSVESHNQWLEDVQYLAGGACPKIDFPIIADPERDIAIAWGMIDPFSSRKLADSLTARCVYFINPENQLMLSLNYPACVGRNMNEIVRCSEALKVSYKKPIATPANWPKNHASLSLADGTSTKDYKGGVMLLPTVSDHDAKTHYPSHHTVQVPSDKAYLRVVKPEEVGYQKKKHKKDKAADKQEQAPGEKTKGKKSFSTWFRQ